MRRTRRSDSSSLLALDDAASSVSRYTNARTHVSYARSLDVSDRRPAKRRKTAGLNSRFDRMIKSVDATLSYRNTSPASSRKRVQSSGTSGSSVSSHDVPKTPVAPYSLHPGKLGKAFSVLKMKKSPPLPLDDSDGFPKPAARSREPRDPLPDWLANTFRHLEADHPLRGLVSPSRIDVESKANSPSVELLGASREEDLFAFSPFDKQEETPSATCCEDNALNVWGHVSPVIPAEATTTHLEFEAPTTPLPFSMPGCFAPGRRSTEGPIAHSVFHKPLVPVPHQATSHTTYTMHPPALPASNLRSNDVINQPRFVRGFSDLVQDIRPPSDSQQYGANMNQHYQVSRGERDNLSMYGTPGPTFACSRPVYFDSPTEDPSLSDPLQPESYELDLNAIDFRWRPFLRSNAPESDTKRHPLSPSTYAIPDRVTVGDQSGWNARFGVDKSEHGASNEDLPCLAEDVDIPYFDGTGAMQPGNVNTTTKLSAINNTIRSLSSPINYDVQEIQPTFASPGVFLSPFRGQPDLALLAAGSVLPRGDGDNIHTSKGLPWSHDQETRAIGSEVHGIRPSTPIRQVPVSPPSTPQKLRSSQVHEMPRVPVRKTASALSWMIPLKSSKCTPAVRDDVNCRPSRVSADSHDSIESWSETS